MSRCHVSPPKLDMAVEAVGLATRVISGLRTCGPPPFGHTFSAVGWNRICSFSIDDYRWVQSFRNGHGHRACLGSRSSANSSRIARMPGRSASPRRSRNVGVGACSLLLKRAHGDVRLTTDEPVADYSRKLQDAHTIERCGPCRRHSISTRITGRKRRRFKARARSPAHQQATIRSIPARLSTTSISMT